MKYTNAVTIDYTNWKGVRRIRKILPLPPMFFGHNQYHPDEQWLLEAMDLEDGYAVKTFAMNNIHSWSSELVESTKAEPVKTDPINGETMSR